MRTTDRRRAVSAVLMRRAVERLAVDYTTLAKDLGVSRDAVHSWRHARREPTRQNLVRMADLLVDRAAELRELATEIRLAMREGK